MFMLSPRLNREELDLTESRLAYVNVAQELDAIVDNFRLLSTV